MSTLQISYGTATAITWTLDSLASSTTAGRECTAIDNTSTKADDYRIQIKIVYPNSATANDKTAYVYAGGWDGTNYVGGLTGSDAAYTFDDITTTPSPMRLALAGFMVINKTRVFDIPSIATVFGGVVPSKFGLAIINYSGQTFSTSCTASYQAITYTAA